MDWQSLNQDTIADDVPASMRPVLAGLGEYARRAIEPLNMRPRSATLRYVGDGRVEVQVGALSQSILLILAPESELAAEVALLKLAAHSRLPLPTVLTSDLAGGALPFPWAVESFIGGTRLHAVADDALVRVASRQVGRALRRLHQIAAPGVGAPTPGGRWPDRTWHEVLRAALRARQQRAGTEEAGERDDAPFATRAPGCERPMLIHGALAPSSAIVTAGDGVVQLGGLTRPGPIIGGDPLYDLAVALEAPATPTYRAGLIDGYTSGVGLSDEQQITIERYRHILL